MEEDLREEYWYLLNDPCNRCKCRDTTSTTKSNYVCLAGAPEPVKGECEFFVSHLQKDIRDKFLTEAMGECWHISNGIADFGYYTCISCGESILEEEGLHYDFSSSEGFFKLFNWFMLQPWRDDMLYNYWSCPTGRNVFPYYMIHPNRFADEVYKFLNGVFPSLYLKWKESGRYDQKDED